MNRQKDKAVKWLEKSAKFFLSSYLTEQKDKRTDQQSQIFLFRYHIFMLVTATLVLQIQV